VHLRQGPHGLQIDSQTAAGIEQWCRHFDRVTFYGVLIERSIATAGSTTWVDTHEGLIGARAKLIALPHAYGPLKMARHYSRVRAELKSAITAHRHLCFTLGNVIGDWPSVAALEAIRQRRRYAAWIDRVEPFIIRNALAGSPARRLAAEAVLPILQAGIRHVLGKSSVALLQGGDTYDYYHRSAPDPHCTWDTHTHAHERIGPEAIARKQARISSGAPLKVVYIGRAVAMKGPCDWLATLELLGRRGIPFQATWIGDGPDLPAIRQRVADLGLAGAIDLPGFEDRREILLGKLADSDLLLFCHKTPESARCLIEALVCGCPIVGYDTAYPRGLVAAHGGGVFTPQDDVTALAEQVAGLHGDRARLSHLIADAAASGELYDEDTVYAHRAELMRRG
jgi:glycosyltransferase involved in cell wall biosynthesis